MGKSDMIIFNDYAKMISHLVPRSVAYLGFPSENAFTYTKGRERDFYDLSLGNWNINDDWSLPKRYDLIVSTRCPYFAKDPLLFISKCRQHLNPNGKIFLDWGLGDHWRFEKFKVGWVRDGEHEFAYEPDNFLHSCLWRKEFINDVVVSDFWKSIEGRFGYTEEDDLDVVVRREVPVVVDYDFEKVGFRFLWPESPQLYIMTLL